MKRKKMTKLTAVVAPVLVMSMALTACSGSGEKEKTNTTPKSSEKEGGKLAAKQVLNLTESQEIPSMDSSKSDRPSIVSCFKQRNGRFIST